MSQSRLHERRLLLSSFLPPALKKPRDYRESEYKGMQIASERIAFWVSFVPEVDSVPWVSEGSSNKLSFS